VAGAALVNMGPGLAASVPRLLLPGRVERHYKLVNREFTDYEALFRGTRRDDVTLALPEDGWGIPTYGGKIVAPLKPQAFVKDLTRRTADVKRFFRAGTSAQERRSIIDRYHATYVLFRVTKHPPNDEATVAAIESLGHELRAAGDVELIRVR
jgi:hypothetical protein